MDIYTFVTYMQLPIMLFALIKTWRYECARWFLITFASVELLDELMAPIVLTWHTHFYIWCVAMNLAFLLTIIYRKPLADWLYQKSGFEYFYRVSENHYFSLQEGAFFFLLTISIIINSITYIEVLLYSEFIINNAYIKLYVRDFVSTALHILMSLALLTYAAKTPIRERNLSYEK
ncbi:hypothetical protein [Pseudoalteromonas rubra]|uniref:Uncharacterized protein n=1 Tax=Pseudoalteromonas rubra TaxID=43658 RepID=A0A0U3GZN3_9GAMM|nr:hypothetical protein [Pseudoalteromonas rubra]ALU44547.1 hypothetical protein AT705_17365 [Pseudoalteromonas rubra]